MGRLANGQWIVEDLISKSPGGEFKRQEQHFRDKIEPRGNFPPEKDRYHLYVAYACPWAHRALIMRKLKGLERIISLSVVSPFMLDDGWTFKNDFPGVEYDTVLDKTYLRDVYTAADPTFSGRVTVPVLLDKKTKKIVNNESSEVIRIMNEAFNDITGNSEDFYPREFRTEIDYWNNEIYENVNNGVYKAGFAQTQDAYDEAAKKLFKTLDQVDERLSGRNFLMGAKLTEADIRLYTTLVRFDPVYYVHFKCNRRMIREYRNLSRYLHNLYEMDAFKATTKFDHIKTHYYVSQKQINPFQIVPLGPEPLTPP
jgi:Predicted glutathione S-transferase